MRQYIYIVVLLLATVFCLPAGICRNIPDTGKKTEQLKRLHTQVLQSSNIQEEFQAIQELEKESVNQKNIFFEGLSYFYYLRYYRYNLESHKALPWLQRLEKLGKEHKLYLMLTEGRRLLVELYSAKGDYGLALMTARNMNEEVAKMNCPLCTNIAKNSLANVYIETQQYNEAKEILFEILKTELTDNNQELSTYINSLLLLTYAELAMGQPDKAMPYFKRLGELIKQEKNNYNPLISGQIKNQELEFRLHNCYTWYYLLKNEPEMARKELIEIKKIAETTGYRSFQIRTYQMHIEYYVRTRQYDQALKECNEALGQFPPKAGFYLNILRRKSELLMQTSQYQQAYNSYDQLFYLKDSVEQDRYIRQINQFKMKYQAEQKELSNRELHLQSSSLYWLLLFLSLFCISLIILIWANKRMKRKLQRMKDKAEQSDRLKSVFLANMNHEIRTPLNAIAGFSQLLADETDPEITNEYITIIKNNNELLVNLLSDVLDISKIEADTLVFNYSVIYLPDLMNGLYRTIQLQIPAGIEFINEPGPDLHLHADRNRLIQVLSNLLSNAIKHTRKGSIRMGYELQGEEKVRFYVADTGEGISEKLQKEIFVRFIQAVKTQTQTKGVGLGLALCKGFIEHMGGEIGVESTEGKGSLFWFTLPIKEKTSQE